MKRIYEILLCAVLVFILAGCGASQEDVDKDRKSDADLQNITEGPELTETPEVTADPAAATDIPASDLTAAATEKSDTEPDKGADTKPALATLINVEGEIAALKNVEGSIYINEDEKYEKMVKQLLYMAQETQLKGSVIVATDEDLIFTSGTRLLDVDGNEVTPYSIYEVGSMTKSFTAVCIMKLIEEGKLSLDTTLGDLFPEYSGYPNYEKVSRITISNMLHMRSGIYDYVNASDKFYTEKVISEICDDYFNTLNAGERLQYFFTRTDEKIFMECLFTSELSAEPDTKFEYSNSNYYLFARIIEMLTGKAYEDNLKEQILEPCGMNGTSTMTEGDVTASIPADAWNFLPCYTKGAGDIHSNVVDMLKYHRALFGGYLLTEASMEELRKPIDGYACGWFADGDVYQHGGDTSGFCTRNYVIERNGKHLYIMMFSNPKDNRGDNILSYMDRLF